MKVVVIKSPKVLSGILRMIFGIKNEKQGVLYALPLFPENILNIRAKINAPNNAPDVSIITS